MVVTLGDSGGWESRGWGGGGGGEEQYEVVVD